MATEADFTPEQWQALREAPAAASMLITLADVSGPGGLFQEAAAMLKAAAESGAQSGSPLVRQLAEQLKGTRPDLPDVPKDRAQAKAALIDQCTRAAAIVSEKDAEEAVAYKTWLVGVARSTAEAAKEGTFLGFGGTKVSEAEAGAINELAAALGL
jgi:hypothetical protein